MHYEYRLDKLKKVSETETAKDIKQLSHAQFPGTHCPLFGVALTAGYVKDLFTLVVGTDECTYYTKTFTMERSNSIEGLEDNFLSFAINQDDVVFGCQEKLEKAIKKIDQEYKPKAILLVTTCVLEIIGEDFEAIVYAIQDEVKAKLMVVHTEHFKCNSHIPGIERSLEALIELMEEQPTKENAINIIGHRYDGVENTELLKLLQSKGIEINLVLPSSCSVDRIATAPQAALNIVTDFTAINLAEKMKKKFGIDYVYFDKYLSLDRVEKGYYEVAEKLNIDIKKEVAAYRAAADAMMETLKPVFGGKTFIYGNTPMLAFEFSSFLCEMGMIPKLIMARDLYINDDQYMKEINELGFDPYVTRIANIAPLQQIYGELKPNIYVGHENPRNLMERGIMQVTLDMVAKKLGFEVPMTVMKIISAAMNNFESMNKMTGKENHHAAS
ncbi:nitrogenase component 1 [Alkaliphilus transvaalensis]|uniref:nitrogenase component 1 n=1 Tax=Alkaliphilus transvaalensis TaxID=114628 RepID=UPI00068892BB|nr:nitrogenase component 1 [Alkaliphilus transvaalensis]